MRRPLVIARVCILLGLPAPALAQAPPPYRSLRYEEDYRYLRDSGRRSDFFDPIKYIALGADRYVSFGGEVRSFVEWFRNEQWGGIPGDDGYLLQRAMVHVDFHEGENARLFAQLKSGLVAGRRAPPRPADKDEADVHQLFLEVRAPLRGVSSLSARVGRQEMDFGRARLLSVREGPNVRRAFDGVRISVRTGGWTTHGFVTKPAETSPGAFDDGSERGQTFWGAYVTPSRPGRLALDFYYFGLRRGAARFDQGTARELRHTAGVRAWGKNGGWDYDVEASYQFGNFGAGDIQAWAVASIFGYTWSSTGLRPRLALSLDVHSGDRDPNQPDLQTYNPLFPNGAYYGLIAAAGPSNYWEVHPVVELTPARQVSVRADWLFFWRVSAKDGVYGLGVNPVRSGRQSRARFVGHSPGLEAVWQVRRHVTARTKMARFLSGRFLHETPPGEPTTYVSASLTYKF